MFESKAQKTTLRGEDVWLIPPNSVVEINAVLLFGPVQAKSDLLIGEVWLRNDEKWCTFSPSTTTDRTLETAQ
ncbi:MAG: hypothetical protein ACI9VM_000403 [Candidatus Azotimanducaceae bacterium]|jgi:hypothetical protein